MAWANPKTNWTPADSVSDADLLRIENNTQYLKDNLSTISAIDVDLQEFFKNNVFEFMTGNPAELWTFNIPYNYYSTYRIGDSSVQWTVQDNTANGVFTQRMNLTWDTTKYPSGLAGNTDDWIVCLFYVSDVTKIYKVTYNWYTVTSASAYGIDFTAISNGWNLKIVKKSTIPVILGAPNWNSITRFDVAAYWNANSINAVVNWQYCAMIRKDPVDGTKLNPLQHKTDAGFVRDFDPCSSTWTICNERGGLSLRSLSFASTPGGFKHSMNLTDFVVTWDVICNTDGYTNGIEWYQDDTHYLYFAVYNNQLRIWSQEGGSFPYVQIAGWNIYNKDKITFIAKKVGKQVSLTAYRNGDIKNADTLFMSTNLTGTGVLASDDLFGTIVGSSYRNILVSNIPSVFHARKSDWAATVGNGTYEVIQTVSLAANAAQVDFTVPGDYKYLRILFELKSSNGTTSTDLRIRLDDVATYSYYTNNIWKGQNGGLSSGDYYDTAMILPKALPTEVLAGAYCSGVIDFAVRGSYCTYTYRGYDGQTLGHFMVTGGGNQYAQSFNKVSFSAAADTIKAGSKFTILGVR